MSKSPYSAKSQKVRLTYRQFEILNILHLVDFPGADVFASPTKRTVFLEFDHFVQFMASNLNDNHLLLSSSLTEEVDIKKHNRDQQLISVARNGTLDKAEMVNSILTELFNFIVKDVAEGKKTLTPHYVYSKMSDSQIQRFEILLRRNQKNITEMWTLFLIHATLMNIKSVIACGEYYKNNMKNKVNVVPMLFIPRLGIMQSLFEETNQTVQTMLGRVNTPVPSIYGISAVTGTLDEKAIDEIYDANVRPATSYDTFAISELFSLTEERYTDAWTQIIDSSTKLEEAIDDCTNYATHFDNVIDFLSELASLTEHFNTGDRLFLVDAPLM